jgi:hypothetical protein
VIPAPTIILPVPLFVLDVGSDTVIGDPPVFVIAVYSWDPDNRLMNETLTLVFVVNDDTWELLGAKFNVTIPATALTNTVLRI